MIPHEKPVRVLIADSQFLITESLKHILNTEGSYSAGTPVIGRNEIIKELNKEKISILIIVNHLLI